MRSPCVATWYKRLSNRVKLCLGRRRRRLHCAVADRNFAGVLDELLSAIFPGIAESKFAAGLAGYPKRLHASCPQIVVQDADRILADHIFRSGDGIGRDRNAAGERLKL